MDIVAHRLEITIAAAIHKQCLVSSAEEVPEKLVPPVVARGVSAQEPFHSCYQISLGGLDDQVEMISHQAPGMDLPISFGAGLAEGLQKQLPVFIASKNVLAVIAAVHHMINRAFILDSEFSCHRRRLRHRPQSVNTKNRPLYA